MKRVHHKGVIKKDTKWDSDLIHVITGNVYIKQPAKLDVENGAIIECGDGVKSIDIRFRGGDIILECARYDKSKKEE